MVFEGSNVTALLNSTPDAMVFVDESGTISFANRQVESMFGYEPDELVGQPVELLLPKRLRNKHEGYRGAFASEPRRREMGAGLELFGLRRDGTEFPVEISLSPVETEHGLLIAGAIRDVSDRVRIRNDLAAARDEAERANRAKSSFLAAASHDLRQPLQTLNLLNAVLRKTANCNHSVQAVEQQAQALGAMTDLLNSLLDISKLESGAITPDIADCQVRDIFRRLSSEFRTQAEAKGLELRVDDCEDVVRTDAGLLSQIIQNLVANAIRYTREGLVQLRCLHMNETVRIEVADTGIGIPREELGSIFEEFYQLNREPGESREGLGLGLSIVHRLAELLDHPLDVQSTPGQGTCFAVTLPRGTSRHVAMQGQLGSPTESADAIRVMLIDDDLAVMRATTMLLEAEGHEVSLAATADEALAVAEARGVPEVIVADLHLGEGLSGLQTIEQLRTLAGVQIPAILVTGDTSSAVSEQAADVPACKVLSKPVNADTLMTLVGDVAASRTDHH
ncbi:MAG: ATP-binding protein [Woeseiaceae bacterium]|nr:ATP-binding protein [Woeseiaceae bacterium]